MEITVYTILMWSVGLVTTSLAVIIYFLGDKSQSTRLFSLLLILSSIWSFVTSIDISIHNVSPYALLTASLLIKSAYFISTLIASVFLIFSRIYLGKNSIKRKYLIILFGANLILACLLLLTDLIITHATVSQGLNYYTWDDGPLWFLFDIYIYTCWLFGIISIFKKFLNTQDVLIRKHLKWLLVALIIGITTPVITCVILPHIGIFEYDWLTSVSSLIWFFIIAYAITKHRLFSIRVVTIELAIFGLWIFVLTRIFTATTTHEMIIESIFLLVTVILGILLVRSTIYEMTQREKIERLTKELEEVKRMF